MVDGAGGTEGNEREERDGYGEELPTMPPQSRGQHSGLRWATGPVRSARTAPAGSLPIAAPRAAGSPARRPTPEGVDPHLTLAVPVVDDPTARVWLSSGPVTQPYYLPDERDGALGPPGEERRRGWKRTVLAALVMICLLAAVAGVVAWRTGALGGTKPAVQAGSGDRGSPEAHFAGLLAAVALGHSLVEGAVAAACTTTPPASAARAAQLARAERGGASYRSVQQQLAADRPSLDEVPSGRVLAGDLGRTTAAELEAEQAYSAWLEDLQATGCYSAPTNDLNYELASQASLSAALAAVKLAATWAGVAPRYHLQTWSAADL